MKKLAKFAAVSLLFAMLCGVCIGYAAVSDTLTIEAAAQAAPPQIVMITEAQVGFGNVTINAFSGTTISSTVLLEGSISSTAVINLTVWNNSPYDYVFEALKHSDDPSTYTNPKIYANASGIENGTPLPAGERVELSIVFSYGSSVPQDRTLNSVIDVSFVLKENFIPIFVADNAVEQYAIILNDPDKFNALIAAMENEEAARAAMPDGDTYIGNVIGSSASDSEAVRELFTDANGNTLLNLEIGGKNVEATVLIKRKNIDNDATNGKNNDGNEMTLYLTTATPEEMGVWRSWELLRTKVRVYAVVFKYDAAADEWVQYSDLVEGTAECCKYADKNVVGRPNDSFNTNTWCATDGRYIEDIIYS